MYWQIKNEMMIALPINIRYIEGTQFFYVTSVYRYGRLLFQLKSEDYNNTDFSNQLNSILKDMKIISVFSRLNPFIPNQEFVLNGLGDVKFHGNIVNIDLTNSIEIQRQKYSRRLKSYVYKARRQCTVKQAETEDEILQYIEIYYENMNRVNASSGYCFDKEYFYKLIDAKDFDKDILIAIDNGTQEIVAGAMFVKKNNIVQYHLSGVKEEFLNLNPIKLLIDEMRIKATDQGYKFFNLGGGLGAQEDSLFHFKSLFSKEFKEFKLWKYIVNPKVYNELVTECIIKDIRNPEERDHNYFPAYRA